MTSEIYKNLWTDCIDANFKCCLFEKANLQKLISEQAELITMIRQSVDADLSSDEHFALEISGFELIDQIKLENAKIRLAELNQVIPSELEKETLFRIYDLATEDQLYVDELTKLTWEEFNLRFVEAKDLADRTYIAAKQYSYLLPSDQEPSAKRVMQGY